MLSFFKDFFYFLLKRKKFWLFPIIRFTIFQFFNCTDTRNSCSTIYLHHFLKMKKIRIIGISAFFHDSAVCLIENGEIIYASQEERFSRIKHDSSFPMKALQNLLKTYDLKLTDINYVHFFLKNLF